jgi:hypothetical protein
MKLRTGFALGTAAVLCFGWPVVSHTAFGETPSLRDSLIGTWTITAVKNQYDDGTTRAVFGPGVTGRYVFGRDGRFSETIIGEPRADLKSNDPRKPDAFIVVNLGHYTVDEASRTITYRIDRAAYSPRNGSERSLIATVHGDTATLLTTKIRDEFGTFVFEADVTRGN